MRYYHGSTKSGITRLLPAASWYSNLSGPAVYLTTRRQLALHYIWDMERIGVKMPMLDIRPDGVLVFQEMFSGALEYFYQGVSGYIYSCEGDFPVNPSIRVPFSAASTEPVEVTGCEYIEDVYSSILSYTAQGMFIYEQYEFLPPERLEAIRKTILSFIRRNNLLNAPEAPACRFVQEKFPQYFEEALALRARELF